MKLHVVVIASVFAVILSGMQTTVSSAQAVPQHPFHELAYFHGETQAVGDGYAYSWVRIDNENHPASIGVTFSESMLANLPDANTEYMLRLPEIVPHAPFDHIAIDWLPKGHYPEMFYGLAHFDFHFYLVPPQALGAITGFGADEARLNKLPPAQYIPQGYVPAKPAVAFMGLHWIRPDFPEFNGQRFTESLLYGSYNGRLTFIEPMVTRDFLLSHTAVDRSVYQPKAAQVSGYYPTRYTISFDEVRRLYTVALEDLRYRQAK